MTPEQAVELMKKNTPARFWAIDNRVMTLFDVPVTNFSKEQLIAALSWAWGLYESQREKTTEWQLKSIR